MSLSRKCCGKSKIVILSMLSAAFIANPVISGTLDNFKKDVKSNSNASKNTSSSDSSSDDWGVGEFIFDLLFSAVQHTALTSHYRVTRFDESNNSNSSDYAERNNTDLLSLDRFYSNLKPRSLGDPDLPYLQLETHLQNVWGDTYGLGFEATVGYGMFAYKYEQQLYQESSPDSDLTLTKSQFLLRLSLGENIEIHQGLGNSILTDSLGFRHEEGLYTSPIKIKFAEEYQFDFSPTWTSSYDEYDVSISKYKNYYSYKLGYKTISTKNTSLSGVYLGVSFQY